jgi:hypothetical protein
MAIYHDHNIAGIKSAWFDFLFYPRWHAGYHGYSLRGWWIRIGPFCWSQHEQRGTQWEELLRPFHEWERDWLATTN